uniref:Uncharacterized protein n=1 Tax=Picea glauca TaxID=3330 RepID=A0A101M3F0_PICGL|nr:hypothetical protein ABT39_MTgene184 [Picea glauca]QHR89321.1 hypothetical protein Q903MT_gene3342 [Picea sitchensis]
MHHYLLHVDKQIRPKGRASHISTEEYSFLSTQQTFTIHYIWNSDNQIRKKRGRVHFRPTPYWLSSSAERRRRI